MMGPRIDAGYFWTIFFFFMLGTIFIRASIIFASARVRIPDRVRELFSFIPAAILPAFIAPAVFFHQGVVDWMFGKERLLILIAATGVCLWTRSTLATIGFGLISLYCVTQIL